MRNTLSTLVPAAMAGLHNIIKKLGQMLAFKRRQPELDALRRLAIHGQQATNLGVLTTAAAVVIDAHRTQCSKVREAGALTSGVPLRKYAYSFPAIDMRATRTFRRRTPP